MHRYLQHEPTAQQAFYQGMILQLAEKAQKNRFISIWLWLCKSLNTLCSRLRANARSTEHLEGLSPA